MLSIRRICYVVVVVVIQVGYGVAQSKVGTTAANFLTIPVGPRASAMGGAFVAVADDATDMFWNAAGLTRLPSNEFVAAHSLWLAGTSLNWFGLSIKLDNANVIGLSVNQLDYGKEEITTPELPNGIGQMWDAQDLAVSASYARSLTDRFSVGGSVKFIQERIWNESSTAYALDIGLLFTTPYHNITIGMNIANFGTEMRLDGKDLYQPVDIDPGHAGNNANIVASMNTKSWTLPLVFTVGLASPLLQTDDFRWMVASDAVYPNSESPSLNLGTEVLWRDVLSARVGYRALFREASEEGLTGGVGLQYGMSGVLARLDYSYSSFGAFGGISKYSLSVGF